MRRKAKTSIVQMNPKQIIPIIKGAAIISIEAKTRFSAGSIEGKYEERFCINQIIVIKATTAAAVWAIKIGWLTRSVCSLFSRN